jgi:hypothetical protein
METQFLDLDYVDWKWDDIGDKCLVCDGAESVAGWDSLVSAPFPPISPSTEHQICEAMKVTVEGKQLIL